MDMVSVPPVDLHMQPVLSSVMVMPKFSMHASSFMVLVDGLPKSFGPPSRFYEPSFSQEIIRCLLEDFQTTANITNMVRLVNKALHFLDIFNMELHLLYDQIYSLLHF